MRRILLGLLQFGILLPSVTACAPSLETPAEQRQISLGKLDSGDEAALDELRVRIEAALQAGQQRKLSASDNAAWQIMHGVLCYGRDLMIATEDRGVVSALDYAFENGQIRGFELMKSNTVLPATGRYGVKTRFNPGDYIGQGHVDQWLAICAMANIPLETKIQVGEEEFTLEDMARQAQYDVPKNPVNEFSWTLIALTHYFPDEPSWDASGGVIVSWEDLVGEELRQDINSSACGGTHRLAGIVRALRAKQRLSLPNTAVWSKAEQVIEELLQGAKENRGADGRLSSFYFTRAGDTADISLELNSTGHMFEFVALASSQEELSDPWIRLSGLRLCELLEATEERDVECGALYHALNGLKIYYQRMFASGNEA